MTRPIAFAALLTLILAVGCTGSPQPTVEAPQPTDAPVPTDVPLPDDFPSQETPIPVDQDVIGKLGEEAVLKPGTSLMVADADLSVRFIEVTEDSRCPTDVDCFWSGLARVSLEVTAGSAAPQKVELEMMAEQPVSQQVGNYTITLLKVAPQPVSTQTIQPDEYRVTIRVDGV